MYLKESVLIPSGSRISVKKIGNYKYVYYQYATKYDPIRKYSVPERNTIGKVCSEDETRMVPNEKYRLYFPDETLPEFSDTTHSSCFHIGSFLVLEKLIKDNHLQGILKPIIKDKYGLFMDLVAYAIVTESNVAQYYPDYAINRPLFTKDMRIYSHTTVGDFLGDLTRDQAIEFLNEWNERSDHRQKIYISFNSTNKKCQAGDIDLVEKGHSKDGVQDEIYNMSIAYDRTNRKPLYYEAYAGSIPDVVTLTETIEKAKSFGYKHAGFILDRGYFSEPNIHYMDRNNYDFVIMVKGMKKLVNEIVLENRGTFEDKYSNSIDEYDISGTTVRRPLFEKDQKDRFIHIYYDPSKAAGEKAECRKKIRQMEELLQKYQGKPYRLSGQYLKYFNPLYYHEGKEDEQFQAAAPRNDEIEKELQTCGYFCIVTSEEMDYREALLLYKSRDDSEKLFRGDKSYLGQRAERAHRLEAFNSKLFVEFVALILRNSIYTSLIEEMKSLKKKYNYMTVPATLKELEKIEAVRYLDGNYIIDHALSKHQKIVLNAFGLTERDVRDRVTDMNIQLKHVEKETEENGKTKKDADR